MANRPKFDLPAYLNDPERLKKETENQAELREAMNVRGRYSSAEKARMFAIRKEDTARQALKGADWESAYFQRDLLAEALIEQGKFEEAGHVAASDHWRIEAHRLHHAMSRDDGDNCICPDMDPNTNISNRNVEKQVWSEKHGAYMPVVTCNICGETNIRPKPDDLRGVQTKRSKAQQIAGGRKIQSKDDLQSLRTRLANADLADK